MILLCTVILRTLLYIWDDFQIKVCKRQYKENKRGSHRLEKEDNAENPERITMHKEIQEVAKRKELSNI